ncbi:hypothetical protein B0T26DRAFT_446870 [Lasiosphaeria miniovina]|uniref:Poly [ADP-ribose] polymerase n=1 Tax=Lasiosphaeria miniovina TaxID=1954250 RepID=A0AA39ZZ82_9PEZI|nr:uncharacterized protein B0T26DRAFT_446870 [Lasiosphaeria miniovina]KAK0706290.1 hypothetical protein B0T26DRAFT_446870 [Lasiosphaeria miniovina]
MDRWRPDPPGTINPAKLLPGAAVGPDAFESVDILERRASLPSLAQASSEDADQSIPLPTAHTPPRPRRHIPLSRISSDWDDKREMAACRTSWQDHEKYRAEFEKLQVLKPPTRIRLTTHHGSFREQTGHWARTRISPDPGASPDGSVVIDTHTSSIYDAYLLCADVMRSINNFHRHQIVYDSESKVYTLWTREGRVGLAGVPRQVMHSTDLKAVATRFRKIFRDRTGVTWQRRFEAPPSGREGHFTFVALDYRIASLRSYRLPDYSVVSSNVNEEVRDLMEFMLYGGPIQQEKNHGLTTSTLAPLSPSKFSAPYEQLSSWSTFLAFKILDGICKIVDSSQQIHWKAILRATSRYRSQIPFCAGAAGRCPTISSYHAIFLELKLLHSLWPRPETAALLTEIHCRGNAQLSAHKSLAQPLYRAYSSLRHGFRRLTDSGEFRGIRAYLDNSCHASHNLKIELQDIYRVFVKNNLPNPYRDWIEAVPPVVKQAEGEMERLLLWHGTPADSLVGILDTGLQIRRPGATFTGTMFGNGIYLADVASKSAGYCRHRIWNGEAVLLLCEADVGTSRMRSRVSIPNGHQVVEMSAGKHRCIEGVGTIVPSGWMRIWWDMEGPPYSGGGSVSMPNIAAPYTNTFTPGGLIFNEYVIYSPSHLLIRYLLRVKIKGS